MKSLKVCARTIYMKNLDVLTRVILYATLQQPEIQEINRFPYVMQYFRYKAFTLASTSFLQICHYELDLYSQKSTLSHSLYKI